MLGYFVDVFDIYLPIVALAPASSYLEATGVDTDGGDVIEGHVTRIDPFTAAQRSRFAKGSPTSNPDWAAWNSMDTSAATKRVVG